MLQLPPRPLQSPLPLQPQKTLRHFRPYDELPQLASLPAQTQTSVTGAPHWLPLAALVQSAAELQPQTLPPTHALPLPWLLQSLELLHPQVAELWTHAGPAMEPAQLMPVHAAPDCEQLLPLMAWHCPAPQQ
jgi:hypothetical protein